jgi:beta-lactamase superfamily II metal-dependent hydrolase
MMILFWLLAYLLFEVVASRRLSKNTLIVALSVANFLIWNPILRKKADWSLEFLDVGRNHAWIFSGHGYPVIACYDSYISQGDVENVFIPHLYDHHGGRLDHLFTITPESPELQDLQKVFSANLITPHNLRLKFNDMPIKPSQTANYKAPGNFPAEIKIIWEESDNNQRQEDSVPALQIGLGDDAIVLADWTGAMVLKNMQNHRRLRVLEMPWSVYAQSRCLEAIELLNPECLVFSPDRFSVNMPESRGALTHSAYKTFSTSICGAFSISGVGDSIKIVTMRPIGP